MWKTKRRHFLRANVGVSSSFTGGYCNNMDAVYVAPAVPRYARNRLGSVMATSFAAPLARASFALAAESATTTTSALGSNPRTKNDSIILSDDDAFAFAFAGVQARFSVEVHARRALISKPTPFLRRQTFGIEPRRRRTQRMKLVGRALVVLVLVLVVRLIVVHLVIIIGWTSIFLGVDVGVDVGVFSSSSSSSSSSRRRPDAVPTLPSSLSASSSILVVDENVRANAFANHPR